VRLNGTHVGQWVLLEFRGRLYASEEALEDWRVIRNPQVHVLSYRGQNWYVLEDIKGYGFRFDHENQTLYLSLSADAFNTTRIGSLSREDALHIYPPSWAGFMNYDVSILANTSRQVSNSAQLSGLMELGLLSPYGSLTSSYAGSYHRGLETAGGNQKNSWARLETAWTLHRPQSGLLVRLGDSQLSGVAGSRDAYFGGLQIGSDLSMRPGFVSQPIPVLNGSAVAPSTLELYVNDALRKVEQVPAGPFVLQDTGLASTQGSVRLVVRDLNGQETVIERDLYAHPQLLTPGLNDWRVQMGRLRYGLGTPSSSYGVAFVSGYWRRGLTSSVSGVLQAEATARIQAGRLGVTWALPDGWLLEGVAAYGAKKNDDAGSEAAFSLSRQAGAHEFLAHIQRAQAGCRALGVESASLLKAQYAINYRWLLNEAQSVSLNVAQLQGFDLSERQVIALNWGQRLGRGQLSLGLTQVRGPQSGTQAALSWSHPFGSESHKTMTSMYLSQEAGQLSARLGASRNPSADQSEVGWRVLASTHGGANQRLEAGALYDAPQVQLQGDVSVQNDQQHLRLGLRGGVVGVGGQVFATRTVNNSVALVHVPGLPDIGVGLHGRNQARTNAQGYALLPQLNPYSLNPIRLDPNELPISAELDTIEVGVTPGWRSAVVVAFPVRQGRSALLTLLQDQNDPMPLGAKVQLLGEDNKSFYVARRGQVFVTGMQSPQVLQVYWQGKACKVTVVFPAHHRDEVLRPPPLQCESQAGE
jgi:outer membrane usher protein